MLEIIHRMMLMRVKWVKSNYLQRAFINEKVIINRLTKHFHQNNVLHNIAIYLAFKHEKCYSIIYFYIIFTI